MNEITRRRFVATGAGTVAMSILGPAGKALAAAGAPDRPNILFLMTDQHNHSVMGCSGNPLVKTPNLDALASEGVRFTNAICPTPFCTPTRASIVTGLWPHTHGLVSNVQHGQKGLTGKVPITEGILNSKGYAARHLGKWHIGPKPDMPCYAKQPDEPQDKNAYREFRRAHPIKPQAPGEGEVLERGIFYRKSMHEFHSEWKNEKRRSKQDLSIVGRMLIPPELTYESWLADRAIELLRSYADSNFILTYSVSPPHACWIVPDPYYHMYDPARMPLPASFNHRPKEYAQTQPARMGARMGEEGIREYLRCYYGQVTMVDWCFGRILGALKELGLDSNTLVLYMSDHGDMQGAHGMVGKSLPAFYEEIARVPLIIRYPGVVPRGKVITGQVSSVDICPTLLDYVGQDIPDHVQARSLKRLIGGLEPDTPGLGFCERGLTRGGGRMVRTEHWKLNMFLDGRQELFDLHEDPSEVNNLAEDPKRSGVKSKLRAELFRQMERTDDPALETLRA